MVDGGRVRRLALAAGCAWIVLATSAQAQAGAARSGDTADSASPNSAAEAGAAASRADIVITGSRIITNGNNQPTPVTVVTTELLAATTPSNISDGLNKLPSFQNSLTVATAGGANTNSSGNFLNLRGIGTIRTLILLDGHRVPPSASDGTVDVNVLPQSLVKRVDVVTGGASAVYGSDAITGVVNFIVDRNFNGLRLQAQSGITQRGDNGTVRLGAVAGTKLFGDRGHIEFSYDYYRSEGITSKLDRPYGARAFIQVGAGTAANPFVLAADTRFPFWTPGGVILSGPNAGSNFTANGVVTPFQNGTVLPGGIQSGGDGVFFKKGRLTAGLETHQAYGRFDYDLADGIRFYAQGGYSQARNFGDAINFLYSFDTLSASNPFLPAALQRPTGTFLFGKSSDVLPGQGVNAVTRNIYVNAGFAGSIAPGVDFDVSYTHGATRQVLNNTNNVSNGRFAAALDAVRDPATGAIVCNVTLTNPGLYPGCVPLNPFGPTSESPAAINYLLENTTITNRNRMNGAAVSVTASPFGTWAGPVQMALSGEYRHLTLAVIGQYKQSTKLDCTGLRFNCNPGGNEQYQGFQANDVKASQNITELALEANVPLLRDLAIAKSLDVNLAGRFANYSTSGHAWTWKAGLDWGVTNTLTVRATRSRDFRAPTLFDLFGPPTSRGFNFVDIHTNVTAFATTRTQGNPNLKPEVSDTVTAGIVYRPPAVPGLSLAVDYFNIRIKNAIASIGPDQETQAQCEASNGTSPLCALFVRPLPFSDRSPANFATLVLTQSLNVSSLRTEGVDGEFNYQTSLAGGTMSLRGLVSYQPKLRTLRFAGANAIDAAGGPNQSTWRASGFLSYGNGPVLVAVQERWRSSQRSQTDPTLVSRIGRTAAVAYTDLTTTFSVGKDKRYEFFVTVQNLFDKAPPLYVGGTVSTPGFFYPTLNGDDLLGRNFTAGFRIRLP